MIFVNPLDKFDITATTPEALRLERKRLLSLADLSSDGMLDIGNSQYLSKSDIIKWCESLEVEGAISFYAIIKKHQLLTDFLTTGRLRFFYEYDTLPEASTPAFLAFIYPYFADQFKKSIADLYSKGSANYMKVNEEFGKMCDFTLPFSKAENMACFQVLHSKLHQSANEIDLAVQNFRGSESSLLDSIMKAVKPDMLNRLPSEFDAGKLLLGEKLYELCLKIFDRKILFQVNLDLLKIARQTTWPSDLNIRFKRLAHKQELRTQNTQVAHGNTIDKPSTNVWHIIRLVAILLVAIIRIATCANRNDSYRNSSYPYANSNTPADYGADYSSANRTWEYQEEQRKKAIGMDPSERPTTEDAPDSQPHPLGFAEYDAKENPFVGLSSKKALLLYAQKLNELPPLSESNRIGLTQASMAAEKLKFLYVRAIKGPKASITYGDMRQDLSDIKANSKSKK